MKQLFKSETLAKELKTMRSIDLNIGLRELSEIVGVSPASLSRIENGGVPNLETFSTICTWLNQPMTKYFQPQPTKRKSKQQ